MGMPLFSAFPGELFIIISLVELNKLLAIWLFFGFFFTGVYTFLQINKILFSKPTKSINIITFYDININSIVTLSVLIYWSLLFGISPDVLLKNV
jgi:NADH:ubiquinone oxidoreductase subunit 4 (subunit M)